MDPLVAKLALELAKATRALQAAQDAAREQAAVQEARMGELAWELAATRDLRDREHALILGAQGAIGAAEAEAAQMGQYAQEREAMCEALLQMLARVQEDRRELTRQVQELHEENESLLRQNEALLEDFAEQEK